MRTKWIKKAAAAVLAAVMTVSLAACGSGNGNTSQGGGTSAADGTHLNFSCYNYSNSMDPITNVNSSW